MSRIGTTMPTEYSDRFDELRQNRVEVYAGLITGEKGESKK